MPLRRRPSTYASSATGSCARSNVMTTTRSPTGGSKRHTRRARIRPPSISSRCSSRTAPAACSRASSTCTRARRMARSRWTPSRSTSAKMIDVADLLHLPAREAPPQLLFIHLHAVGAQPLAMVPKLAQLVIAAQHHFGVGSPSTALIGYSQGGIVALEAAQLEPPLAGRVVAIAARYARLPERAPAATVLHLAHGKDDSVVPARFAVEAATRLVALGGDVTADIVPGIGHAPHPELVDRAIGHMQTYLPRRVWAEALAAAPVHSTRVSSKQLASPIPDSKRRH